MWRSLGVQLTLAAFLLHAGLGHERACGAGVLDHLPDDALGFVTINRLGQTDAKIDRFAKLFKIPLPTPLTLLSIATGLGEGVDTEGDALLGFLPGTQGAAQPAPMLLIPVSDYEKFVASIQGDRSGEICRVTISGEEVLVARDGDYAMLMNLEDRVTMETLLPLDPEPVADLEPLREWMADNEIVAMLMPEAVDLLVRLGREGLQKQREQLSEQFDDPDLADMFEQIKQSLIIYDQVLGFCGAEIDAAALGISLDAQSNLRIGKRVIFEKGGQIANVVESAQGGSSPLQAHHEAPFVAAGGGPLPEGWADAMAEASRRLMQQFPQGYDLQDLDENDWEKAEKSWAASMKGVRGISVVFRPGKEDDPLYSNIYGLLEVEDSTKYLETYRESVETWNELFAASPGDMKIYSKIEPTTVADRDALLIETDILAAVMGEQDDETFMKPMMELMFGPDAIMRLYVVAVDSNRVATGMADKERIAQMVEQAATGNSSLAASDPIQITTKLLDADAPWQGVVSPVGCVRWASRFKDALGAILGPGGGMPNFPEFPSSPPLGFSAKLDNGLFAGDMVCPVETLQAFAAYVEKLQTAQ